jgi:hypothetical protein
LKLQKKNLTPDFRIEGDFGKSPSPKERGSTQVFFSFYKEFPSPFRRGAYTWEFVVLKSGVRSEFFF